MVVDKRVKTNPGSRYYRENRSYREHRGYYWKDQQGSGRWRTPDGKIARGQTRDPQTGRWNLERAERYNENRRADLIARHAVNAARKEGVPLKLKEARQTADKAAESGRNPRDALVSRMRDIAEDEDIPFEPDFDVDEWGYV